MKVLVDPHGRRVRKLRISLTDQCNLRCHYCMPVDARFMDESRYLSPEEYREIVGDLCDHGLEELRITGGEPLMRKSFDRILDGLADLPLKKLGLTSNGVLLDRHFETLLRCGVRYLNISLDSLNAGTFKRVTHGDHHARVMRNISQAIERGFHVKVNVVAMKGVNDGEILEFVDYSEKTGVELRFLELMRIGHAIEKQREQFISAAEILARIRSRHEVRLVNTEADATAFSYRVGERARIGFIASESQAFCGQCSRWRLSADGKLHACLFKEEGISVRGKSVAEREPIYRALLGMKPSLRPAAVLHSMNSIGG